jgi:type II secretion system protein H
MRDRSKTDGFTLVELIITMVIAGILMSIVTMNFASMNRKAGVEKTVNELVTDLNMVRSESVFRGKRHSIVINAAANGYAFRRYSSLDEPRTSVAPNPATATNPPYGIYMTKTINYGLAKESGATIADRIFEFDRNGFTNDFDTIRVNPVGSGAAFDCIVVSATRTNIGRMEGGSCVQR